MSRLFSESAVCSRHCFLPPARSSYSHNSTILEVEFYIRSKVCINFLLCFTIHNSILFTSKLYHIRSYCRYWNIAKSFSCYLCLPTSRLAFNNEFCLARYIIGIWTLPIKNLSTSHYDSLPDSCVCVGTARAFIIYSLNYLYTQPAQTIATSHTTDIISESLSWLLLRKTVLTPDSSFR